MSTITVDVRDFEPTGPIPVVTISRARVTIDAAADTLVSTAAAETVFPNDAGTSTFTLTADTFYLLTVSGLTGIRTPFYVRGPQTSKSLAALYRQDRINPITLERLPAYPSIAVAIAAIQAELDALELLDEQGDASVAAALLARYTKAQVDQLLTDRAASVAATYSTLYASAATKAATAPLLGKLKRGIEHATELAIGDSTGNEPIEHFYLAFAALAARFPAYTAVWVPWDVTNDLWPASTLVQTGTGARSITDAVTTSASPTLTSATASFTSADIGSAVRATGVPEGAQIKSVESTTSVTLTVNGTASATGVSALLSPLTITFWSFSVPGSTPGYVLGYRWAAAVQALPYVPDLMWVSHGHNMGDPTPGNSAGWRTQRSFYLSLTEELTQQFPGAGLVMMSQNPTYLSGRSTWQAIKASIVQKICAQRGYGFIDVHQAFQDTGSPQTYVKSDLIHPTTTADAPSPNGSQLWADVVSASLVYDRQAATLGQPPSALTQTAAQLLSDPRFESWSSSAPDNWVATNATISQDFTNFETGTYGAKITAGGTTGSASMDRTVTLAGSGIPGRILGRTITVIARVYADSSYTGSPSLVLKDSTGGGFQSRTDMDATLRGRFTWLMATKRISTTATSLTVQLAPRLSGAAVGSITVDRFYVIEGDLPREGVAVDRGPAGATGSASAGQIDYLSTLGDNPALAFSIANTSTTFSIANNAILVPIKPHRNMSITKLAWYSRVVSGNYDIGIYDSAGNRLWSKGSTAWPAANSNQTESVSPAVALTAGNTYWVALAGDNTTAAFQGSGGAAASLLTMLGGSSFARTVSAAMPLPSSITLGSTTSVKIPAIVLNEA